jgi:hypothetical protein
VKRLRKIWIGVLLLAFLLPLGVFSAETVAGWNHGINEGSHGTVTTPSTNGNSNGGGTITFAQNGIVSGPTTRCDKTTVTVVNETLTFSGNLTGTAHTIERLVKHNDTDDGANQVFTNFHGRGNFTGTLNGATVTLHIRYEGVSNATYTRGHFVLSGSENENTTVHGQGRFAGALKTGEGGSSGVDYMLHSQVKTHRECHEDHPEARDNDRNDY